MYELCALLRQPKARKASAPRKPSVKVGGKVMVHGRECVVTGRDTRYAAAWFVADLDGNAAPYSFSRDMIKVL